MYVEDRIPRTMITHDTKPSEEIFLTPSNAHLLVAKHHVFLKDMGARVFASPFTVSGVHNGIGIIDVCIPILSNIP